MAMISFAVDVRGSIAQILNSFTQRNLKLRCWFAVGRRGCRQTRRLIFHGGCTEPIGVSSPY